MSAYKAQWTEGTVWRGLREKVKRLESKRQKPAAQFEETREEIGQDENCKMVVDSEADSLKKLDQQKKRDCKAIAQD